MTNSQSFSYINILCLDRSHSTIANEFLAEELNGIALGEVARIIAPKGKEANYFLQEHNCSCGKIASVCLFWGDILKSREVWKTYSGKNWYSQLIALRSTTAPMAISIPKLPQLFQKTFFCINSLKV